MTHETQQLIQHLREVGLRIDDDSVGDASYDFAIIRDYEITTGSLSGQVVDIAIWPQPGYPINPPGGIHVTPVLAPPNPVHLWLDITHNNVLTSATGRQWQYWSRPFRPDTWRHDRPGKSLLTHIASIFSDA